MARRTCRLFHVDAFTRERFAGNPAVVVLDADELTDEDMHRIAREINGTEVAFVLDAHLLAPGLLEEDEVAAIVEVPGDGPDRGSGRCR